MQRYMSYFGSGHITKPPTLGRITRLLQVIRSGTNSACTGGVDRMVDYYIEYCYWGTQCTQPKKHDLYFISGACCGHECVGINCTEVLSHLSLHMQLGSTRKHKKAYCNDKLRITTSESSVNLQDKTGKLHLRMNYWAMVRHPCIQLALSEQQSKSLNHKKEICSYSYMFILTLHVHSKNMYKQKTQQTTVYDISCTSKHIKFMYIQRERLYGLFDQ